MGSKIFLVLGHVVAIVLVITVEVAARDLAETSTNRKQNVIYLRAVIATYAAEEATVTNGIGDSKDSGYGDAGTGPGGAHIGHPPASSPYNREYGDAATIRDEHGYIPSTVGNIFCRNGCCGGIYPDYCTCCPESGEAVEAKTKAKPHN